MKFDIRVKNIKINKSWSCISSSICQLHQLADHNGIYSIQRWKSEEDFNLAFFL